MVQLKTRSDRPSIHRMTSNKSLANWTAGDEHEVYIMVMTDGRYIVFSSGYGFEFYQVLSNEELHETFNEV